MSALKPCPFCNSVPQDIPSPIQGYGKTFYKCINDKCASTGPSTLLIWNKRPVEETLQARIKLLDSLLRQGLQSGCFAGELKDKVNDSIAAGSGE